MRRSRVLDLPFQIVFCGAGHHHCLANFFTFLMGIKIWPGCEGLHSCLCFVLLEFVNYRHLCVDGVCWSFLEKIKISVTLRQKTDYFGATTIIMVALRRVTFSRMTFCRMTFNRITLSRVTFSRMTFSRVTFSRMTFSRMTFNRMTFNRMTFIRMTSHRMASHRMAFNRVTFSRVTFSRVTFSRVTFNRVTFSRVTFSRVTFSRVIFSRMTFNRMKYHSSFIEQLLQYSFSYVVIHSAECHCDECCYAEWRGAIFLGAASFGQHAI
jgi:hypothetical protein